MSALRLQADGIRGGQEFDVPPVRPLFYSVRTETGPEAADDRRSACAGDIFLYFRQTRGVLETPDQLGRRMFRMQAKTAGLWRRQFNNLPFLQRAH